MGSLATALAAAALAIVFTMGPFSHLLGFNEFDVLMVIGLPVMSLPGGSIGGAVLGSLPRYKTRIMFRYSAQ